MTSKVLARWFPTLDVILITDSHQRIWSGAGSLVMIMAWRQPGDKPLSEPMSVKMQSILLACVITFLQVIDLFHFINNQLFGLLLSYSEEYNSYWCDYKTYAIIC